MPKENMVSTEFYREIQRQRDALQLRVEQLEADRGETPSKVLVDARALGDLLGALDGPTHLILELQITRGPLVGDDNPINKLVESYEAWRAARGHK